MIGKRVFTWRATSQQPLEAEYDAPPKKSGGSAFLGPHDDFIVFVPERIESNYRLCEYDHIHSLIHVFNHSITPGNYIVCRISGISCLQCPRCQGDSSIDLSCLCPAKLVPPHHDHPRPLS